MMEKDIADTALRGIENVIESVLGVHKLNIGIVCHPSVGGSGIVGTSVGSQLASRGHEVHVISYKKPFRPLLENIRLHLIPVKNFQPLKFTPITLTAASKIYNVVKKNDIDIINVHYAIPYSSAAYMAKQMCTAEGIKAPVITTVHGTDIHTIGLKKQFRDVVKFTLKSSDGITAVCSYLANQVKRRFDFDGDIRVIYNFVDTKRFTRKPGRRLHRQITKDKDKKVILHVSNFRKIKRIDDIIEAFKEIKKAVPSKLVLVGDGPEKMGIRAKVRDCGISKDVIFLKPCKDIEKFYSMADLFMLASEREGCPLSILEAMSSKVPVVATNVGGIPEIIENGKEGFLARLGDVKEIADMSIKILSDEQLWTEMGREGRKKVLKKFTADKIIPQYESFYRKVAIR